jgi:4-amino-4-deoxy-L-arabinose transferase-like glycosyltransferase
VNEATPPRRAGRRARTVALIFVASAAFLAYAWLLFWHASFSVGGSDSSGFANAARLILAGRVVEPVEALKHLGLPPDFVRLFIPLAFEPGPRPGTMVPFYPPGFPLHVAFAGLVGGWNYGPFVVSPLAALASVFLIYLVGRELGLSRLFATAGAAVLALCPVFVFMAEQPMGDIAATMWSLAAVLFALRSRRREAWAAAAGAAFGIAVMVRPTNALLLFPIAFAIRLRPRTLLWFLLGGAPFAAVLLVWNQLAFGSPFRIGYSSLGEGFSLSNFAVRFRHYGGWLAKLMSPLLLAGWVLAAVDRRLNARNRFLLLSWFGGFFLFYCFWVAYDAWWYTRFLLPSLPALILASLLVARDGLSPQHGGRGVLLRRSLAALLLAIVLLVEGSWIRRFDVLKFGEGERLYPDASRWAESQVPPRSLVVSMQMSGALKYYTNLTPVRWDWIQPAQVPLLRERAQAEGYQWFALLVPFENEELQKRLPWGWTKMGMLRDVTLWRLDSNR